MNFLCGIVKRIALLESDTKRILLKVNTIGTVVEVIRVWKVVKLVSIFTLTLAINTGCGEPNIENPKVRERIFADAMHFSFIQTRSSPSGEELAFAPNQNHPYTGWIKGGGVEIYDSGFATGANGFLIQVQRGKPKVYMSWYPNGQILEKGTFSNSERHGVWIRWHENGQMKEKGTYKNDDKVGLWVKWDEDGEEVSRDTY